MQRFKRLSSTGLFRANNVLSLNIKSRQPSTGDYFCETFAPVRLRAGAKQTWITAGWREDDSLKEYDSHPSPNIANFLLSNPHLVYLPDGFLFYFIFFESPCNALAISTSSNRSLLPFKGPSQNAHLMRWEGRLKPSPGAGLWRDCLSSYQQEPNHFPSFLRSAPLCVRGASRYPSNQLEPPTFEPARITPLHSQEPTYQMHRGRARQ